MSCPPGMDPSYLFRSPLLSDAENNNLMAAAAAAEKTRALLLMGGGLRPPTGPPPPHIMPPPPLFPNPSALAALTSSSVAICTAASALTTQTTTPGGPQLNSTMSSNLISHWSNAIHQAALANSIQMASAASAASAASEAVAAASKRGSSPPTPNTSDLRLARPLFPLGVPGSIPNALRFSPYIIPTVKRTTPSPPNSTDSRLSPLDRIRSESASPTA